MQLLQVLQRGSLLPCGHFRLSLVTIAAAAIAARLAWWGGCSCCMAAAVLVPRAAVTAAAVTAGAPAATTALPGLRLLQHCHAAAGPSCFQGRLSRAT